MTKELYYLLQVEDPLPKPAAGHEDFYHLLEERVTPLEVTTSSLGTFKNLYGAKKAAEVVLKLSEQTVQGELWNTTGHYSQTPHFDRKDGNHGFPYQVRYIIKHTSKNLMFPTNVKVVDIYVVVSCQKCESMGDWPLDQTIEESRQVEKAVDQLRQKGWYITGKHCLCYKHQYTKTHGNRTS